MKKMYIVTMPAVFEQRIMVKAESKKAAIKLACDGEGEPGDFVGDPIFSHSLDKKFWSAMRAK